MSNRHNKIKSGASHYDSPNKEMRKIEHKRVRHAAHQALHVASTTGDYDDVVVERPHHTREKLEDLNSVEFKETKKRFKVWKTPFWKRRDAFKMEQNVVENFD